MHETNIHLIAYLHTLYTYIKLDWIALYTLFTLQHIWTNIQTYIHFVWHGIQHKLTRSCHFIFVMYHTLFDTYSLTAMWSFPTDNTLHQWLVDRHVSSPLVYGNSTKTSHTLDWVVATQIMFFIFIPIWGNDPIWRAYVSNGLVQPPTSRTTS